MDSSAKKEGCLLVCHTVSSVWLRQHTLWARLLLFTLHITGLQTQLEGFPCAPAQSKHTHTSK